MRLPVLAALAALVLTVDLAAAQESRQPQPRLLHRGHHDLRRSGQTTRRPRSAAQLRNDQIMRTCGAEWRRDKTRLQAAGKTWRTFLPECRGRQRG